MNGNLIVTTVGAETEPADVPEDEAVEVEDELAQPATIEEALDLIAAVPHDEIDFELATTNVLGLVLGTVSTVRMFAMFGMLSEREGEMIRGLLMDILCAIAPGYGVELHAAFEAVQDEVLAALQQEGEG